MTEISESTPDQYVVAVRALCAFTAKRGDLDLRFTPSPSAQQGMVGHAIVASRRSENYQPELSLSGEYRHLKVRGRADGYDPDNNRLEEVKTYRGDLAAMPENHRQLHWAQVRVYGWLLCQKLGLAQICLSLVYFDIASMEETPLTETVSAADLKVYFEDQCERFLAWSAQELAHRRARNAALEDLAFPYDAFRAGQRDLAEAVYKSAAGGRCLLAQAPTGIGKTVATLFPLLKAAPRQSLDKIFFLAAKTPGRKVALDALKLLRQRPQATAAAAATTPLRVLELVARDKACEHPDKACHGDSCPLAKGFYDRLPAARAAAVASPAAPLQLDREALRSIAADHGICPYYLSQDLVSWSDVVVGDYNYYFDVSAMLHAQTMANQWRIGVLVDEAHNMVERARKMYSATLDSASLAAARQSSKALHRPLDRLQRAWKELHGDSCEAYEVVDDVPVPFVQALQQACSAISEALEASPTRIEPALQAFYFEGLHFLRMAESFGKHSLFDMTRESTGGPSWRSLLCIRNVVPAPFLAPRFAAARSVALFSATLNPRNYYADTLGLPAATAWVDVQSPFDAAQLSVQVVRNLSTRYQHRSHSLAPIADLVAGQYAAKPGNYMVFLSSYDYLEKLAALFSADHPGIPVRKQTRDMTELARKEFLDNFSSGSRGVGFAVLGGSFAEGIDLPGDRLIGAFVATLGLPQVNPVNEQIRERMAENFGADVGYDYTYLYPGLQKVVQAAGRVIRTSSDVGVVYLMDDRFSQPQIRSLLPAWWDVRMLRIGRRAQDSGGEPPQSALMEDAS